MNNSTSAMVFGNAANTFSNNYDFSRISTLVASRNARFHLDLSNATLVEVLEAKEAFSKKMNPRYKLSHVIGFIKRLEEEIGGAIMPIDITDEFYVEVTDFSLNVPGPNGKTLKPSSISNYFSCLQGALSWGSKHRAPISETYNCWKSQNYERHKIALSPSMIAHIYYYDLKNRHNIMALENARKSLGIEYCNLETIQRVKDHFVLLCQIGQRYSDSSRFTKSNFDDTGTTIKITQQKTGNKAVINLANNAIDKKIAFEILKKYDYCSPAAGIDISNFNKYLHMLCKSIGGEFDSDISFENKINGSIVTETYKVWQLITTHTARRTFITYWASSNDMNIVKLQKCTGHKDVRQINRYTILEDD